jgi:hypothetical protein
MRHNSKTTASNKRQTPSSASQEVTFTAKKTRRGGYSLQPVAAQASSISSSSSSNLHASNFTPPPPVHVNGMGNPFTQQDDQGMGNDFTEEVRHTKSSKARKSPGQVCHHLTLLYFSSKFLLMVLIRQEMTSLMIGCPTAMNISQFSLKKTVYDHPSVTFATWVNPPTAAPIALAIPSSVVLAFLVPTSIHHSISLSGGLDSSSNPSTSGTSVSFSIWDMVVNLALQTRTFNVLILPFGWLIPLGLPFTDSKPAAVLILGPCTFNSCRWTFSHQQ